MLSSLVCPSKSCTARKLRVRLYSAVDFSRRPLLADEQTHRLMLPNAALITAFGSNKRMFSIGAMARGDNLSTRAFMSQMRLRNICRSCSLYVFRRRLHATTPAWPGTMSPAIGPIGRRSANCRQAGRCPKNFAAKVSPSLCRAWRSVPAVMTRIWCSGSGAVSRRCRLRSSMTMLTYPATSGLGLDRK